MDQPPLKAEKAQVHFVANCVYGNHVAGGDIHFFNMADAVVRSGYDLHFFGGKALAEHLAARKIPSTISTTDRNKLPPFSAETLQGQFRLLFNYLQKFFGTLPHLRKISSGDIAYAVTDYWFDTLPVLLSAARGKMMVLGMDSPTLWQVITRGRPDVAANRLASLYYWGSQTLSLRLFSLVRNKVIFYVHPTMERRLLRLGFREDEIVFISNGYDSNAEEAVPPQEKTYDVIWTGRPHRQKGIDDLLESLSYLSATVPDFRAVLVGKLQDVLGLEIRRRNLEKNVEFAGYVPEEEKFRLFKASRLFLMPSRYESWGIVIAEALSCGTNVLAYDLEPYRPIFGDLVEYVPGFDEARFRQKAVEMIRDIRAGGLRLPQEKLHSFKRENSWEAGKRKFAAALIDLDQRS